MKITIEHYKTNLAMLSALLDEAELAPDEITDIIEDIIKLMWELHLKRKQLRGVK